jgi:RiboL-PSP-HEPN
MSKAGQAFEHSIKDAECVLTIFNKLHPSGGHPPPEAEVLKRAGLIMAMTSWETYVEDRLTEALEIRLAKVNDQEIASLLRKKLSDEITRLHNPTSERTLQLFVEYANVDLTEKWRWLGVEPKDARDRLNKYLKLRGDVVHRARKVTDGPTPPHAITKDELKKVFAFLHHLVEETEKVLDG